MRTGAVLRENNMFRLRARQARRDSRHVQSAWASWGQWTLPGSR
jgi:hypothetical protein